MAPRLALMLAACACNSPARPLPPNDPPGAIRMSETTNHQFGACYVGTSNLWERNGRPSGTLSIADANANERTLFVFVGDELEVCGTRYRVITVEAGRTPGAVVLLPIR